MNRIRKSFALGIVFLLLATSVTLTVDSSPSQEVIDEPEDFKKIGRSASHRQTPIRIDNNTDLAEQAEANDWPGDGNSWDPYVIEGYHIDAHGHGYGIYIGNVTDHFTIRECTIEGSSGNEGEYYRNSGIYIYNTANGRIQSNIIYDNDVGIVLNGSNENTIVQNDIVENSEGLNLMGSYHNLLGSNHVLENEGVGISIKDSYENQISYNNASYNEAHGLLIVDSNSNYVSQQESRGNDGTGIAMIRAQGNLISNSDFSENVVGIEMESSEENELVGNTLNKNQHEGIRAKYSDHNVFDDIALLSNEKGIHLISSNSNVVNYTNFLDNTAYGLFLNNSEDNQVYHNNFIDNDVQAFDNTSTNQWIKGYPDGGNYWSDHEGDDENQGENQDEPGSDGIIDEPYEYIEGDAGAQDNYPLIAEVPTPHVRIESPEEDTEFSYSEVTVTWTSIERFTTSLQYEVRLNEKEWIDVGKGTEYTFTKLEVGTHTVEVRVEGLEGKTDIDSVDFTVDYTVTDISMSPKESTVTAGESQEYDAVGYYNGEEIGSIPVDWSIDGDAGGYWDRDVYISEFAGNWTVTGTYEEIEDEGTLNVKSGPPRQFKFDTIDDQTAGESFNITITAFDEYGNLPEDYTGEATLEDDTGTIEPNRTGTFIDNSWSGEVTITRSREDMTIRARDGRIYGESSSFNVTGAKLDHIEIYPSESQTVVAGDELQFSAEAFDVFGNMITDDAMDFEWENTSVEGIFEETIAGEYSVRAEYENLTSANVSVTVEPSKAESVELDPREDLTVTAGVDVQFSAEAYDEYGNLVTDDEEDFLWSAEGAFIDAGLFYHRKVGDYSVTAILFEEREIKSAPTVVTVEPADASYVMLAPQYDQVVKAGEEIDFSARVYDEYDNLIDDDDTNFTWKNTDDTGLFYETVTGIYNVTASYEDSDKISETVSVEVEPADASYVMLAPEDNPVVKAGEEIDFSARVYDEYDNLISDDEEDFLWQNTDDAGLFYKIRTGIYNVTASYDGVSSEITSVTVEPSDVHEIKIDPSESKLISSLESVDFSAEAYDVYGNLVTDDAEKFTWENTSAEGLFDHREEGVYQVTASFDDVISTPVMITVELEEFKIVVGPILNVNEDPVSDAYVNLSWNDNVASPNQVSLGVYEFRIGLMYHPDDIQFNYTIEHEDLSEQRSGTFNGFESGELKIEDIGQKPRDPAGVGLAVIIIFALLILVILMATKLSLQKTKESQSLEQLKKAAGIEKEDGEEDFIDDEGEGEMHEEIEEEDDFLDEVF